MGRNNWPGYQHGKKTKSQMEVGSPRKVKASRYLAHLQNIDGVH